MENIQYFWSVFLRRLPTFVTVATLFSAASVFLAMSLPTSYVSKTRLIVESPRISSELAPSTVFTTATDQLQFVEERLLTRANLLEIAKKVNVFAGIDDMTADQIVSSMSKRTIVRRTNRRDALGVMEITFEAPTGAKAAAVLDEYLVRILKEDEESRTGRAIETLAFFEREVDRLSSALAERNARILEFKTANSNALPESLDYRLSRQAFLQDRLSQLERDISSMNEQRAQLIKIYETTGRVAGSATPGKTLSPSEKRLQDLRAQLNDALGIYTSDSPRVKLIQGRIEQLEKVIRAIPVAEEEEPTGNTQLDAEIAGIAARLKVLDEEHSRIDQQLKSLTETIEVTPANAIRLEELALERDNIQDQYNIAVQRLSRASTGERIEVTDQGQRISVVEPPAVPLAPSKPDRLLIAGGGTALGVFAGLSLVVLLEFLDKSIRRPEDLVSSLGITPLATIPYVSTFGETVRRRSMRLVRLAMILIGLPLGVYLVHAHYQPLDVLAQRVIDKVGVQQ